MGSVHKIIWGNIKKDRILSFGTAVCSTLMDGGGYNHYDVMFFLSACVYWPECIKDQNFLVCVIMISSAV
jgi:hypothetical protein